MREMPADQTRVKKLIADTVILLCQQGLSYSEELKIQGVIAVTVDRCDMFVVQLDVTTTQNKNTTKRNPDVDEGKKVYVDNDDVIEVLPVVDLTTQEEAQRPPKPSTPRTPATPRTLATPREPTTATPREPGMPRGPATPRGQVNPPGKRCVSSRNLFAQSVSPQVAASPQRCRTQPSSSNCVLVGVASPVVRSPSRFSGPAQSARSPIPAWCRPHKPASDAVMVIEDDRDDVVIVASDSGIPNSGISKTGISNRGGTLEIRVQQSMCGATVVSKSSSPAIIRRIVSRVSAGGDHCSLSAAEVSRDCVVDSPQVIFKSKSDAVNVSSFSAGSSFPPSSVLQSSGVYALKTPDPRTPAYRDVAITSSQSLIINNEASRPFVVASPANSQFVPLTVSEGPSTFLASAGGTSPSGPEVQAFRAANGGVSGRSATGPNRAASYEEIPNCKTEGEPCLVEATPTSMQQSHLPHGRRATKIGNKHEQVFHAPLATSMPLSHWPLSVLARGNVIGLVTMDPPPAMTNTMSQSTAATIASAGLNGASPSPLFTQSSVQQREQLEEFHKQVELVLKPHVILNADAHEPELHPWAAKAESATTSDDRNWSPLLLESVSSANDSTLPEVYTDIADDRSSDCRHTLVTDENNDEMLESSGFFTPFHCKFPGCVGSYVDGAQLATHYSITHSNSLDLCKQQSGNPENTETPDAPQSATSEVDPVKNAYPCPAKGCEFVSEVFGEVSAHHRQVHSRSISPRVRQQMIWRKRDRASRSPRGESVSSSSGESVSKSQEEVEELRSLLPEVVSTSGVEESGDQGAPLAKKPLYGCLCIDGSCQWTTTSWDLLLSHMHLSHNFIIDSAAKNTESSSSEVKPEPFA